MLSQRQLRQVWSPPCTGPYVVVAFPGAGRVKVRASAREAFEALAQCFRAYRYDTRAADTGATVCRDVIGRPGVKSMHAYGTASDTNWTSNDFGTYETDRPRGMNEAITRIRTKNGKQVFNCGAFWPMPRKDCFTGDTMVITVDGPRPVRDLVGAETVVLSTTTDPRDGQVTPEWVKATTDSFGFAEVHEVTFRRRNARVTVRTTPNHRWPVKRRAGISFVHTADLHPGDSVPALQYPAMTEHVTDPDAVANGIVWGDGSVYNRHGGRTPQATVQLCGDKIGLRGWIEPHARYWRDEPAGERAYGLPAWMKSLPHPDSDLSVLAGFFAGWFATDGHVHPKVSPSLSTSDPAAVAWVKVVAPRLGLTITAIHVQPAGVSGFGSTRDNYQVLFRSVDPYLLIRTTQREAHPGERRWFGWTVESVRPTGVVEEVFCPTVPGRNVVAIDTPSVPLLSGQSMHDEVVCSPQDLAHGIDWSTVPGGRPGGTPTPTPPTTTPDPADPAPPEVPDPIDPPEDTMFIVRITAPHPNWGGTTWEFFESARFGEPPVRRMVPKAGKRADLMAALHSSRGSVTVLIERPDQYPMLDVMWERWRDVTPSNDYAVDGRVTDANRQKGLGL